MPPKPIWPAQFFSSGVELNGDLPSFAISNNNTTMSLTGPVTNYANGFPAYALGGGRSYFEWKIESINPSTNSYIGVSYWPSGSGNTWTSVDQVNSGLGDNMVVDQNGNVWAGVSNETNHHVTGSILNRPLQAGDIVGIAVDNTAASGALIQKVNIHINGTWAGSNITTNDVNNSTKYLPFTGIDPTSNLFPWIGGKIGSITATLNSGQEYFKVKLPNYKKLGSPVGQVGWRPGPQVVLQDSQTIANTISNPSTVSYRGARADRAFPFTGKVYFEVTASSIKPNSRFGFNQINYGLSSQFGNAGSYAYGDQNAFEPSTGKKWSRGSSTTYIPSVATGSTITYGLALSMNGSSSPQLTIIHPLGQTSNAYLSWNKSGPGTVFYVEDLRNELGNTWSINGGHNAFVYGPPSGFTAWDDL